MGIITSIEDKKIRLASGAEVAFPFPIGNAIEFGDVTVVRLEPPRGTIFNENVYGLAPDGRILWQIQPEYPPTHPAAWRGLEASDGQVVLSNAESQVRYVDPKTGAITHREMSVR